MVDSDGLLIMDAPADLSVFLPSKLIDYIGAARPILGITPPGTSSDLIRKIGGWVAHPSRTDEIITKLRDFISHTSTSKPFGQQEERSRYDVSTVTRQFNDILTETLKAH